MTGVRHTWVKICGLRTAADVDAAVRAGADAVGFVFHAASPRHLAVDDARALQHAVPDSVARVAVFLHPSRALVDDVLGAVQPDYVQTDADDLEALQLPAGQNVLPVLRSGTRGGALPARFLYEGAVSGAGAVADWSAAEELARRGELVLAGGLDPSNVGAAIGRVRPFGVDVSSGVESSRGVKDAAKIREFVAAVRAADARRAG